MPEQPWEKDGVLCHPQQRWLLQKGKHLKAVSLAIVLYSVCTRVALSYLSFAKKEVQRPLY